jgi:predicted pyridoxine 5'-phosphate oxidase superfamily flavin-nucleotide-binding protein
MMLIDDTPNDPGKRIESVWMVISVDEHGNEGVVAAPMGGLTMPLIASDEKRLALIQGAALAIKRSNLFPGRRLKIIRLTQREDGAEL